MSSPLSEAPASRFRRSTASAALTPRLRSGERWRITSATPGGMSRSSGRLAPATRSANGRGVAEDLFERKSFAARSVEFFALPNLPHQFGIAQDFERRFQALVFVDVEQHGGGPTVARDDDLFLALLDTGDQLRQPSFHLGNRQHLRHRRPP